MALVLKDRVKETTTTTGTGTLTLLGAATGYQSFSAIGNGNTCYYAISATGGSQWEVGIGTYSSGTLTRDTVLSSSAAGALVNLSAGTKDVYVVYPAEKAIYEEGNGTVLFDGGPITVIGNNVTSYTQFSETLSQMYANVNNFAQSYVQNLNDGAEASSDFAAYNSNSDGNTYFVDMGISSPNAASTGYPNLGPNVGYVISYGDGGSNVSDLYLGSGDGKVVIFAGAFDSNNTVATFGTDLSTQLEGSLNVATTLNVTGAATFANTVTLASDPTTALQAATKQYVDNQTSAGIHIHTPVRVERGSNLTATYTQGGTTFNITDITGGDTLTTSVNHGLSVDDQIWLTTSAGNGLSINTPYFVYSTPAANQLTISASYAGPKLTGLTNASGLSYATRANSGVGATLTNAGTQTALVIDGISVNVADRVLVYGQTNTFENGVYTVTNAGSGSTNWVLTRATDQDTYAPFDTNGMGEGDYFYVTSGNTGAGESYVLTTPGEIIVGYTPLTYTQFSASVTYTGGTNINVSGQTISLTGTVAPTNGGTGVNTVATGDLLYGSGTNTWSKLPIGTAYKSLVVNGTGTQLEWNAVPLDQSGAVSGTLDETHGGTGQNTYTLGDTLYSSATNTLTKLAGNTTTTKKFLSQTGTGATSAAPAWEQPAASDITGLAPSATTDTTNASNITSGTLANARTTATANNGANTIVARDASGNFAANGISAVSVSGNGANLTSLNGSAVSSGTVANARTTASSSNGASTIVARDASGNFSAGVITATSFSGAISGDGSGLTNLNASAVTTGTLANARTTASSTNGASTIVARDASGNFAANTVTANLTGTASNATVLQTARNFEISGGATAAAVSFNGSAGVNLNVTALNASTISAGTIGSSFVSGSYTGITGVGTLTAGTWNATAITDTYIATISAAGKVANSATTATASNGASTIVARDADGSFSANVGSFTTVTGAGSGLTSLNASNLASGTVGTARLASGTANNTTFLRGDQTWAALSAPNNGTLTMNVSGTGLSGSATFTADQAGNTTFTVTSNASSANGASTLVARDASGNFSANTITANLNGNASTATSATSATTATTATTATQVSNSLTMAVSGTGLSGSATFNGSSAQTFTVTSNASASNGASTIVARDASGNFAANTITATTFSGSGASLTSLNASAVSSGTLDNARTSASSSNGASTIVARDASGNFSANTITATLSGNASTATTATTANALNTGNNYQVNSLGVGTAASGTAGEIRATNNITAYFSDDRLKTRLGGIPDALAKLKSLEGFYYEPNQTAQAFGYEVKKEVGVSAQQVQAVMPEVVAPAPIDDKYLTVRYERLVPLLIEAIKELEAQVAELKKGR